VLEEVLVEVLVVVLVVLEEVLVEVTDVELVVVSVGLEEVLVEVTDVEIVVAKEVANVDVVVALLVALLFVAMGGRGVLVALLVAAVVGRANKHGAFAPSPHCVVYFCGQHSVFSDARNPCGLNVRQYVAPQNSPQLGAQQAVPSIVCIPPY